MKYILVILLNAAWLLQPFQLMCTHIVGGEITYEKLTGAEYRIRLIVYRDCEKGVPDFDYPAYIGVFNQQGERLRNIALFSHTIDTIPLSINDSCTILNAKVCYEIGAYESIESFPNLPGGYLLAYDRCCWNASVTNILSPLESGITITTTIPDSATAYNNSSPYFKLRTPPFLCANQSLEFDHSAIDPDGDSLVYELFTPLNTKQGLGSELPPPPPPYDNLIYRLPYNLGNIMGGEALAIDLHSGSLTAVPSTIGQFVFGVRVNEYRNGELIGFTARNYQFNIQPCQRVTNAAFPDPIIQCGDNTVTFENNSNGASGFYWHFGDTLSNDSISNSPGPTHIYSSVGSYQVTLIAHSVLSSLCNDTTTGFVSLYPKLVADFEWQEDKCQNYVQFTDITNSPSGAISEWLWYFSDGYVSQNQHPYHEFLLTEVPTSYVVSMAVKNEFGCEDSVSHIYTGKDRTFKIKNVGISKQIIYPRNDSALVFVEVDNAVEYKWSPAKGLTNPEAPSTYAKPRQLQKYEIRVTDARGCEATGYVILDVYEYFCGEKEIYVPNAFSPNSDGENDYLRVRGEELTDIHLSIYNRWGELVFESTDLNMLKNETLGWDGSHRGRMQDPGVYVYYLKGRCADFNEFTKKGNITLLR